MSTTHILKYPLHFDTNADAQFYAPRGRILKVAYRNDGFYVWIQHDNTAETLTLWKFCHVMTGEAVPTAAMEKLTYVDTIFKDWLVIHIFFAREE